MGDGGHGVQSIGRGSVATTRAHRSLGLVALCALLVGLVPVGVAAASSGTFVDDDGLAFEPDIEAVATAGITRGCNPPVNDRYCPHDSMTRAEMAAFLIRALGLEPSTTHAGTFSDVPAGTWYAGYVERLAEVAITRGYADGTFRPSGLVTRAEMAAFLIRAFDDGSNLGAATGLFADVAVEAWYAQEAERLHALDITLGCATAPLRYCPHGAVTRGQMAAFVRRALGLPLQVTAGSGELPAELQLGGNAVGASVNENAVGHVIHVDVQHPSASDSNSGSLSEPLRTITAAVSRAHQLRKSGTGVRVAVHPGIYRESVEIGGGAVAAPLVVEATGAGAVIAGSDVWTGWTKVSGSNTYERAWNMTWGVSSTGVEEIVARREMVIVGGTPLRQVLAAAELSPGSFFVSEAEKRVMIQPPSGIDPNSTTVEVAIRAKPLVIGGAHNVVVRGLTLRHGTAPFDDTANEVWHSRNVLLDQLTVEWNTWAGLSVCCSEQVTIRETTIRNNGGRGLSAFRMQHALFDGTATTHNNWRGVLGGFTGFSVAGMKAVSLRHVVFRDHVSTDNAMRGFWFDTDISDVWIDGLTSCRNQGYGIFFERIQGPVSMTNSLVCDNGAEGVITSNIEDVWIWGTSVCSNGKAQLRVSGDSGGTSFTDWLTGATLSVPQARGLSLERSTITGGTDLFQALMPSTQWNTIVGSLDSDHNTWFNPITRDAFRPGGSSAVDLAGWQRATGLDGSSQFASTTALGC